MPISSSSSRVRCAIRSRVQPSSRGTVAMFSATVLVREQPDLLDHVADLAAQLNLAAVEDAAPAEQDVAAAQRDHAVDQAHRGRLAGTRRPDQHADLAGPDGQAEIVDRRRAGRG